MYQGVQYHQMDPKLLWNLFLFSIFSFTHSSSSLENHDHEFKDSGVIHIDADYESQSKKQSLHKRTPLKKHQRELLLDRPFVLIEKELGDNLIAKNGKQWRKESDSKSET